MLLFIQTLHFTQTLTYYVPWLSIKHLFFYIFLFTKLDIKNSLVSNCYLFKVHQTNNTKEKKLKKTSLLVSFPISQITLGDRWDVISHNLLMLLCRNDIVILLPYIWFMYRSNWYTEELTRRTKPSITFMYSLKIESNNNIRVTIIIRQVYWGDKVSIV